MSWIESINQKNFGSSFSIDEILNNSVFYPASGTDGIAIEELTEYANSFVHVDYSMPRETVEQSLRDDFTHVGYNLIGLRNIREQELTPNGFTPHNFPLQESERKRIHFLNDSRTSLEPFALWAVYELNTQNNPGKKLNKFSILHIGGEACATFDALYVSNKVNPVAIAILCSAEGYGDNWTKFTDADYRFYKLIKYNVENNGASFPKYLLTNMHNGNECFWPNFTLLRESKNPDCKGCAIFELE